MDATSLPFFCATELLLVVAITTIARAHHDMRASTASALVGAAILSTLIYPLVGLRLRRNRPQDEELVPASAVAT